MTRNWADTEFLAAKQYMTMEDTKSNNWEGTFPTEVASLVHAHLRFSKS